MRSVFIALLILNIDFRCLGKCSEDSECYENICLEAGYCRDIRPPREPGEPIIVDMKYEIDDIISVDIDLKVVGVQISMTQTWIDNRVNVSKKVESQFDNGEWISAPSRMYNEIDVFPQIWTPRIWILAMTNFEVQTHYEDQSYMALERVTLRTDDSLSKDNPRIDFLKRHSPVLQVGHFIHYLTQFNLYYKCDLDFHGFPFDKHICNIEITSNDLNAEFLQFETTPEPSWNFGKKLNRHKTRHFNPEILPLKKRNFTWAGKPWSITGFSIELTTRSAEFVYNYMFPSALCVMVSWITFLIPPEDVNGRVAILITMLLVLVTIFNSVLEKTPRASDGTTAIISWMLVMLSFVCAAFVAYACSLMYKKKKELDKSRRRRQNLEILASIGKSMANNYKKKNVEETDNRKYFKKHRTDMIILGSLIISFWLYIVIFAILYLI